MQFHLLAELFRQFLDTGDLGHENDRWQRAGTLGAALYHHFLETVHGELAILVPLLNSKEEIDNNQISIDGGSYKVTANSLERNTEFC